jgi:hypothetical protein
MFVYVYTRTRRIHFTLLCLFLYHLFQYYLLSGPKSPKWHYPGFPTNFLHTYITYSTRVTCPTYLVFPDFFTLIIFGDVQIMKILIMQPSVAFPHLGPIFFIASSYRKLTVPILPKMSETKYHTHTRQISS